jgi:hypothetical protein
MQYLVAISVFSSPASTALRISALYISESSAPDLWFLLILVPNERCIVVWWVIEFGDNIAIVWCWLACAQTNVLAL